VHPQGLRDVAQDEWLHCQVALFQEVCRRKGLALECTVVGARLRNLPAGQYTLVVEAAREMGGRESVRVPFRWGAANTASGTGSSELGAVRVAVTR
jgi:hypothetical protein